MRHWANKNWTLLVATAALITANSYANSTVTVNDPDTQWNPVSYGTNYPDPSNDQQTGSEEGDVVGNQSNPAFFSAFNDAGTLSLTDGELMFRLRVGMDKNPPGYAGAAFVGLDLNGDGALDLFVGVDNSGSKSKVGIWDPGTGANTSPSTTTIANTPAFSYAENTSDYSWMAVTTTLAPNGTTTDVNGDGNVDYYLSFAVPLKDVISAANAAGITGVNQDTRLNYVAATATQANSLNQDLVGVNGGVNSSTTWAALGAMSTTTSPDPTYTPTPTPEPSTLSLILLGIAGTWYARQKKQRA